MIIDELAKVFDRDSPTLNGGSLTVTIQNPDVNDRLEIRNNGPGQGQIGSFIDTGVVTWADRVTYGGIVIGTATMSGGQGSPLQLQVTFNAISSPAAADALIRCITFRNVALPGQSFSTVTRTLRFEI